MARVVALQLLLFLLPFIGYGFYLYFSRMDPMKRESWESSPIYWLSIAGLLLTITGFVLTATFSGAPPGSKYTPAQLRDGKIEPGHLD
jgi:O-antigen/teichoic acid export membrane protein